MSGYPLGSFPQFGHQARWAAERRQRAIHNARITKQWQMEQKLRLEVDAYNWLATIINSITAKDEGGEKLLRSLHRKMETIRKAHESGKRVYFKRLGNILTQICEAAPEFMPFWLKLEKDQIADAMECLAENPPKFT